MPAFFLLATLNALMAVMTFATGIASIKLSIALSQMSKVTALSTGILIGTVLGVILPEGVQMLFTALHTLKSLESFGFPASFIIGFSVLLGFIVLYVIEHMLGLCEPRTPPNYLEVRHQRLLWGIVQSIAKSTLTLSLIVHSFVDGIALGVSFLDENTTIQLLFLFMIVIHKIPMTFSLTVILLQEGVSLDMCKYHILAFALATPLSSILAYVLVLEFHVKSPFVLGVILLFSAGTFLFSALHVMKETSTPQPAIASVQMLSLDRQNDIESSSVAILLTIAGMLLPLIFSLTGAD